MGRFDTQTVEMTEKFIESAHIPHRGPSNSETQRIEIGRFELIFV
jgi:hypothetical protein